MVPTVKKKIPRPASTTTTNSRVDENTGVDHLPFFQVSGYTASRQETHQGVNQGHIQEMERVVNEGESRDYHHRLGPNNVHGDHPVSRGRSRDSP